MLTTDRGLLRSVETGDTMFLAFDCAFFAIAALLGLGAWRASRPRPASSRARALRSSSVAQETIHV